MNNPDAIIIGAGPAGLASAASMGELGLRATVLEKADTVGAVWRRHHFFARDIFVSVRNC